MAARLREYSNEELNYFRICHVSTSILPKALRTVFKHEWDTRYKASLGQWLNTAKNASDFYNGESLVNQRKLDREPLKIVKNGNIDEWDCTCCFFAILNSTSIGATISPTVESSIKDLRYFRNTAFAHVTEGTVSDKNFQTSIQIVIDAFTAIGLCTDDIENVKAEKTFSTQDLNLLEEKCKQEREKVRQLEEQVKTLEDELRAKSVSFCNLPAEPSHETVARASEVTLILQELENLKQENADKNDVTVLFLSGNPGCGKSQVARQVGERYQEYIEVNETAFVATLNAENVDTVLESYMKLASLVGCSDYSVSNPAIQNLGKKEKLTLLKSLITAKTRRYSHWLIIVDNVVDVKSVCQYWPQPGTKEWGRGQVLVTTQDSHSIPSSHSRCHHVSISGGMEPREAVAMLSQISGVSSDNNKEQEVALKLEYQPLALACAAVYVKHTAVSWEDYLVKLEEGKRKATEKPYESTNLTYTTPMTTAIELAVQREIKNYAVLHHAFKYLSLLAHEKIALTYVTKYVLKRLPEAYEHVIQAEILSSSLILTSDANVKEIKVHQTVYSSLKLIFSAVTDDSEDCAAAAILSFSSLVNCDINDIDLTVDSKTLVLHFCHFYNTVEKFCELDKTQSAINSTIIGDSISRIGQICKTHGEFEQARKYHQQALIIHQKGSDSDQRHIATCFDNLGIVLSDLDLYQEAKDYHQRALTMRRILYGSDHPSVATSLDNLGLVYSNLKQYQKAMDCHQQALDIYRKPYSSNQTDVATTFNRLGLVYYALGSIEQASNYFQQSLAIRQAVYGNDHPLVAASLNNVGLVINDLDQSRECHEKALLIDKTVYGNDHPRIAYSLNRLGIVYHRLGQHQEATGYYHQALAIRKTVFGNKHKSVAPVLYNLAFVNYDLGQYEEARNYHKQALAITPLSQVVFFHPLIPS